MNIGYIIPIIIVIALVGFLWWKRKQRDARFEYSNEVRANPMLERISGFPKTAPRYTEGGVRVHVEPGASCTETEAQIIEAAITDAIKAAKLRNYTKALSLTDYEVGVLNSFRSPEGDTWCFRVSDMLGEYGGTSFDQGGYVLAAEAVASYGGKHYKNVFCVADAHGLQKEKDREDLFNAARAGTEHIVLFHNDPAEYERTKVHYNTAHPLF